MAMNKAVLEQIEIAELILAVDFTRLATDPFKLPAYLLALVQTRLATLRAKELIVQQRRGGLLGASGRGRAALDRIEVLLRDGYNRIQSIPSFEIDDPTRLGIFTSYGWDQGQIGEFDDPRIEQMAHLAIDITPTIANPDHRYTATLVGLIQDQLDILNAEQTEATGGPSQVATQERDIALVDLQTANDRVRFYYCSASDDEDRTPELARINKQPHRPAGTGGPQSGTPQDVTFDAATNMLSTPAMPPNTNFLRAYLQAAGGEPEPAGVSTGTSVSVIQNGALTPGVTYEFWLVGVNDQGEGPPSNRVTHVVPVGP